jgi:HAMP domain-containing protein
MRLAPLDWFVIGETPLREAYAPLFESLWLMAGVGLGGLVLAGAASMGFARRMTDPIRHLQAGAEQIGAGAFDYRIPVRSDDELGDLAARFNAMAERLQASYETLEARVREDQAQRMFHHRLRGGFRDEADGAQIERAQDRIPAGLCRNHEHRKGRMALAQTLEQGQAAAIRKRQVQHDELQIGFRFDESDGLQGIGGLQDPGVGRDGAQCVADGDPDEKMIVDQ